MTRSVEPGDRPVGARRVYRGAGIWEPLEDGTGTPQQRSSSSGPRPDGGRPRQARRWLGWSIALRLLASVPLVWAGAVAGGASLYLCGLVVTVGDPGTSLLELSLLAAASFLVAAIAFAQSAILVSLRPRSRLGLVVWLIAAAVGVASALLAVFGVLVVAMVSVAVTMAYVVVTGAGCRFSQGKTEAVANAVAPPSEATRWVRIGDPSTDSVGRSGWLDLPAHWSWEAGDGGREPRSAAAWALAGLGAAVAAALAAGAAFVSFSLWVVSGISGQRALGWADTLASTAWQGSGAARILHTLTLVLVNLGSASLTVLLVLAVVRLLGGLRGRVAVYWAVMLGTLTALGVVAWLVDPALPRF